MSDTDILILILTVTNVLEMYLLIRSTRATQRDIERLCHDPKFGGEILLSAIDGWIEGMGHDPKKQENFFLMVQTIGKNLKMSMLGGGDGKPVRLKGFARVFEPFINSPEFQDRIGGKIADAIEGKIPGKNVLDGKPPEAW